MAENKKRFLLINLGVIILAFLAAIFIHAYIGSFSRYLADDYCTAGELRHLGFWPSQRFWYTQWTGRYAFIFTVTTLEMLGSNIVPFMPGVYLVIFFLSAVFFMRGLLKKTGEGIPLVISIFLAEIIVFLTLYTAPNIGQNLYWLTGSANYFAPNLMLFLLLGILLRFDQNFTHQTLAQKIFTGFSVAVLSWAASGFSEIITVIQFLVLLSVNLYLRFFHQDKRFNLLWGIAFLTCFLGLMMMIVSPGNAVRMRAHPVDHDSLFFLFTDTLQYSSSFLILWFLKQTHLIWPIGMLVTTVTFVVKKYFCPSMGDEILKSKGKVLISVLFLIFLVFASFLPTTWATGYAPENRVLIYPTILLSIFLVTISAMLGMYLCNTISINKIDGKVFAVILIAFTLYFAACVPAYEGRRVYYMKAEAMKFAERWEQREVEIEEKIQEGQTALTVKMIPTNIMGIEHLQADPRHWINICAARYYGIESIGAE